MKKMFLEFNNQARNVQEVIEEFINTKRGKKADETITYYTDRLTDFNNFLKKEENITSLHDLTRAVVDRYMDYKKIKRPNISNQTYILRSIEKRQGIY